MDFKDSILQFASRVDKLLPQINTEEATKNALVLPFIQLLGFDVFNPFEVNPEFIADIGIKKGEKVDYAIMKDEKAVILIECKHYTQQLDPHNSQLFRYYHTSDAKFGLLTNGLNYRFYTDLSTPNKMDEKPFFEFKITEIKDNEISELKKFHKSYFDIDKISNTASELKYLNEVKGCIQQEISNPSTEFVKYFAKQAYPSMITSKVLEQFTFIVKNAFSQHISDTINDRLKSALNSENKNEKSDALEKLPDAENIITTQEELEAYMIVKSILRKVVDVDRIICRDAQTYCAILLDDNNRKPICRLYFNGKKKFIALMDENKKETKEELGSLDSIFDYGDSLIKTASLYAKD
jgi:hypothetical protein